MENNEENRNVKKLLIIYLVIVVVSLIICFGFGFYAKYSYMEKQINSYNSTIDGLHKKISDCNKEIVDYKNKLSDNEKQIEFLNKYVAICPLDGSSLYHTYNCTHYDHSLNFYIYNIPTAQGEGFSPCRYCENENNVTADTSEIVYVTNTGSKYHRSWCSYLKSSNAITKEQAISKGYTACSVCNP